MPEVIVRPRAQADIREAALWHESRRPGLGSELTLRFDALIERIAQNPLNFRRLKTASGEHFFAGFPMRFILLLQIVRLSLRFCISAAILPC